MPDGVPVKISPERREEFSPGLDQELLALIQATAEIELQNADSPRGPQ
jgi:Mn-containing catalase